MLKLQFDWYIIMTECHVLDNLITIKTVELAVVRLTVCTMLFNNYRKHIQDREHLYNTRPLIFISPNALKNETHENNNCSFCYDCYSMIWK